MSAPIEPKEQRMKNEIACPGCNGVGRYDDPSHGSRRCEDCNGIGRVEYVRTDVRHTTYTQVITRPLPSRSGER